MRLTKRMPSISNVTAGGTATLDMPTGLTYEKLTLYTGDSGGLTDAQIKNIRLSIDGKPVMEFGDAAELRAINKYYGRVDETGYLTLYFVRPEMRDLNQQRVTGLGTQGVQTLQLEFDIDSGATTPKVTASAVQSSQKPLGLIVKHKRFVYASAVSGQFEIDNIPQGPSMLAVHFVKSGGDISRIEVEQNSRKILEGEKGLLQHLQKQGGRTPQTDYIAADWTLEGDIYQSIDTNPEVIQDQRFRLTTGSGGQIVALVEYLSPYAGI